MTTSCSGAQLALQDLRDIACYARTMSQVGETSTLARQLADALVLGAALDQVRARFGSYELVDHWQQGEFHHDTIVRAPGAGILVIATNCNGGVKEVLRFDTVPDRSALWHSRCPTAPEFSGQLPEVRERAVTDHWFDPCDLLAPDARSELREEFRERQPGGGWRSRA